MTETVTVGLFEVGTDPVTLDPTRVLVESYYEGKARIKFPSLNVSTSSDTSQTVNTQQPYLSIPSGSPVIPEGAEVLVTASTVDPLIVGLAFTVEGVPQSGQTTSHRYPLEGVS